MVFLLACIYQSISISIFPKLLLIIISIDILPPNKLSNWNILKSNLSCKTAKACRFFSPSINIFLPISHHFSKFCLQVAPPSTSTGLLGLHPDPLTGRAGDAGDAARAAAGTSLGSRAPSSRRARWPWLDVHLTSYLYLHIHIYNICI